MVLEPASFISRTADCTSAVRLASTKKKRIRLRDTKVYAEDIGQFLQQQCPGMIRFDTNAPDQVLTQYGHYPKDGVDGRYDCEGPRYHKFDAEVPVIIPEGWTQGSKLTINLNVKPCSVQPYEIDVPEGLQAGDTFSVNINRPGHEWWRGMRKGKRQLLFETGHIDPRLSLQETTRLWLNDWGKYKPSVDKLKQMRKLAKNRLGNVVPGKKNATLHLQNRRDFKEEKTVIEKLFLVAGHLTIASPKYHPEIAGQGIEYCWGKAKYEFRNNANDCVARNLERNVQYATGSVEYPRHGRNSEMCKPPLSVERARKFARKARTYRKLFDLFPTPDEAHRILRKWQKAKKMVVTKRDARSDGGGKVDELIAGMNETVYTMIAKMYKLHKTHCNLIDMEFKFCVR